MNSKKSILILLATLSLQSICGNFSNGNNFAPATKNGIRPPAVPLITIDPYTSAWSFGDKLNENPVTHWTGKNFPLMGGLRVDGTVYRFMGKDKVKVTPVIGMAATKLWEGVYTESEPKGEWTSSVFDTKDWKNGKAGFGTKGNPFLSTPWTTDDIWIRRTFDWPADEPKKDLYLQFSHDDNIEIYLNGKGIAATGNGLDYDLIREISDDIAKNLKPTGNVLAAHCRNNGGGAYVDMGIMKKVKSDNDVFEKIAIQKSVVVMPTQTYYTFECGNVQLELIFTAPLLMNDLDLMTSPFNYVTYQVKSMDKTQHDVQLYLDATPQWAVNNTDQEVTFDKFEKDGLVYLKTGSKEQKVLGKSGDNIRIDWGYFYLISAKSAQKTNAIDEYSASKKAFSTNGKLSNEMGQTSSQMKKLMTVLAMSENLDKVSEKAVSGHILIAYDDIYSIQYFGENRMPYWRHDGKFDFLDIVKKGEVSYSKTMKLCADFDQKMMTDAAAAGGQKYAELCALAYRQAITAHKLVTDKQGNLLFLSKENFSNGSIGTVDVTYPSAPLFLLYNPDLLKGMLNPIFNFCENKNWTKPFAAHDVGTYPLANGQTYGGNMPVEESGNMLILTAAIALREGNADYALKHWDILTVWANYLLKEGLDPENQLCTDDFAGHFAHNTNLSIKAIMGIAGYSKLAEMLGKKDVASNYLKAAQDMANQWITKAEDGDHFKLTFDKSGTWSQKYNLVWDRILGFSLFPKDVAKKEMAFYMKHQNKYGLPLDNREDYTKSDWILWTACLTGNDNDFKALVDPVWLYAHQSDSRVPLSDWHFTTSGYQRGFQARSVVGGYFMKMLESVYNK